MAKDTHSAIPSWSGYVYQGKVAFYHVLAIVEEKFSINPNFNFLHYALELEWQEDFSVLINGSYESIHQVKAYASGTSPTVYNSALVGIFDKLDRHVGREGWLHIWTDMNFTEKTSSKNFQELKESNKNSYSQSALDKTDIYKYSTGKQTCGLDEVDQLILEKIDNIYILNNFEIASASTSNQHKAVRFKLFDELDTHILEVHKGIRSQNETIPFNALLDIFKNNYEAYSQEYEHIKVKDNLFEMIYRYCSNSRNCSIDPCDINCHLYKTEQALEKKSAKEIYDIIFQSTPHYDYRIETLMNSDGLIYGLVRSFHILDRQYQTQEYLYKRSSLYLPTTIHNSKEIPNIAKNIFENKNLDSILQAFEVDTFISDDVESTDILKDARDSTEVGDRDIDSLFGIERRSAIDKIKKIQIKKIDDVKEELS